MSGLNWETLLKDVVFMHAHRESYRGAQHIVVRLYPDEHSSNYRRLKLNGPFDMETFREALRHNTTLRGLSFSQCDFRETALFRTLRHNRTLPKFGLYGITGLDVPSLCEMIRINSALTTLCVLKCSLSESQSLMIYTSMCQNKSITSLDLSKNRNLNMLMMCDMLCTNKTLTELKLNECDISSRIIFDTLCGSVALTSLHMAGNTNMHPMGLADMLLANTSLKVLNIANAITEQHYSKMLFQALEENTTLTELDVRGCALHTPSMNNMLRVNTSLKRLETSMFDTNEIVPGMMHNFTLVAGLGGYWKVRTDCIAIDICEFFRENRFYSGEDVELDDGNSTINFVWESGLVSLNEAFQVWPMETSPLVNIWQYMYGDGCLKLVYSDAIRRRLCDNIK